jgi:hypothetical protein
MQIYIAAVKIGAVGADFFGKIVPTIPVYIGLFRVEHLAAPSVVYGHIDFLHIRVWLIGLEQVVYTIPIRSEHIGQTVIHAVVYIETN